jgi:hypothetical protein
MLADIHGSGGAPPAGTRVALLNQDDGRAYAATVETWIDSSAALVVSTRVAAGEDAVRQLADRRVWMSIPETDRGFTVFSGVAQPASVTSLDIIGVALLLAEPRRQAARAPASTTVTIVGHDQDARRLRGVDLAQGGVRVALNTATDLVLGDQVTVDVHLEDGTLIPATGQVTRLDEQVGQAVVRFDELPSEQATQINRYVLLQLTHN